MNGFIGLNLTFIHYETFGILVYAEFYFDSSVSKQSYTTCFLYYCFLMTVKEEALPMRGLPTHTSPK
ncbi:hypothetical protein [Chryseobacterium vrystaatense]|uniref:Uncharacterized protein n=1 Tax=Chryseobacterium vrystaatense TaxID=307480 RepID=A0ABR4UFH6_9FLAO|nr:hypothetical protein [Chryseobacterium vrystaatense]KFF23251.1 hypothetical protein IW16_23420 [Chryseobacterium vrystaatense]